MQRCATTATISPHPYRCHYLSYCCCLVLHLVRSTHSLSITMPNMQAAHKPRGAFIVLEGARHCCVLYLFTLCCYRFSSLCFASFRINKIGVDRCGKTTQVARLVDRLARESQEEKVPKQMNIGTTSASSTARSTAATTTPAAAVVAMRFPDRTTPTGRIINEYLSSTTDAAVALDDHAIHLLFSANRWEASTTIQEHLRQGTTIICDRYVHSGVAFSSAKVVANDGGCTSEKQTQTNANQNAPTATLVPTPTSLLSLEWCKAPDIGLPAPDCVIFLDMSPEETEQRGG